MELIREIAEYLALKHHFGTLANLNVASRQLLVNTDPILNRTLILDNGKRWWKESWEDVAVFRKETAHRNWEYTK